MFYIAVRIPGKPQFWLRTETNKNGMMYSHLHTSALFAEAFKPQDVEVIRQCVLRTYPGCVAWPIEANSNKIIPINMKRSLNLA